jgi:RNA polymerase sigma factor (sigma-70 family)
VEALNLVETTEQELVEGARNGSSASWEGLLSRYHPMLLRFLTAAIGDPEEAAHLAQETWIDAVRGLPGLAADRAFLPWLYAIARNNLLPYWRRRARLQFTSLRDLSISGAEDLPESLRAPDEFLAVAERDLVQQTLAQLSPPLREALLLHALNGLSATEIAALLGIATRTAEQRVVRAKRQFRAKYAELAWGGGGGRVRKFEESMQRTKHLSDSDLVAYEMTDLAECRRQRIAAHLGSCAPCQQRRAAFLLVDRQLQERYPLVDDPTVRGALLASIRAAQERHETQPERDGKESVCRAEECPPNR